MESKKNTKDEIAEAFKLLLVKKDINKITVKELADSVGVIRPTFYNHFTDKYEVLEYIIWNELLLPARPLLENDMIYEGVALIFSNMKKDKEFYARAVNIEGQNSFEIIARQQVTKLLLSVIDILKKTSQHKYAWLSREIIAEYYAQSMCYVAISWIKRDFLVSPKELAEIYEYLTRRSMVEVIEEYI